MDDRYQFQNRVVKTLRWLRWRPLYMAIGAWRLVRWTICGCHRIFIPANGEFLGWSESRLETAATIWSVSRSECQMKMKHYRTCDEILADLRGTP
jgi:hypothetical protein